MNIEYVSLILLGINNFISLKENQKNTPAAHRRFIGDQKL